MDETTKNERRYENSYYKCRGSVGQRCNLDWRVSPSLFQTTVKPVVIPVHYRRLGLIPKQFSSRCKRCSTVESINAYKSRPDGHQRGLTLEQLEDLLITQNKAIQEEQSEPAFHDMRDEIDDLRSLITADHPPIPQPVQQSVQQPIQQPPDDRALLENQQLQIKLKALEAQNVNLQRRLDSNSRDGGEDDSLIDQCEELTIQRDGLQDQLKKAYALLYNNNQNLAARQRKCRRSASIPIRQFYRLKNSIETQMHPVRLHYNQYLDEHRAYINPEDWDSDCNSNTSFQ